MNLFRIFKRRKIKEDAPIDKSKPKSDVQKIKEVEGETKEAKISPVSEVSTDISGKKARKIIEKNLDFTIVDFYKENEKIIGFGLAQSKPDINISNWYRIISKDKSEINPKDGLLFKNAHMICGGKILEGGCDKTLKIVHPDLQTPEGDLLMQMEGVLRFWSKCSFRCSCGISYLIYADAEVGKPNECYLTIYTTTPPDNLLSFVRPFFEADEVALVSL